jgi:hypothetical protein
MHGSGDIAGSEQPRRSGAPDAGGATTFGSQFGGTSFTAHVWRFLARSARTLEALAYRRLRDLEQQSGVAGPGSPRRAKAAANEPAANEPTANEPTAS